jgi:hypothetical protein
VKTFTLTCQEGVKEHKIKFTSDTKGDAMKQLSESAYRICDLAFAEKETKSNSPRERRPQNTLDGF